VHLPVARMAPISSSSAGRHVRYCWNTGARVRMMTARRAGRCMAASLGGDVPAYRQPAPPPHPCRPPICGRAQPKWPKIPWSRLVTGSTLRLRREQMGEGRCVRLRVSVPSWMVPPCSCHRAQQVRLAARSTSLTEREDLLASAGERQHHRPAGAAPSSASTRAADVWRRRGADRGRLRSRL
jgi:hypothetical protein